MKNVILLTLLLLGCLIAHSQNYLQEGNACFDKGNYECAKQKYTLWQTYDGKNMSAQIQKADECLKALMMADEYYNDKGHIITLLRLFCFWKLGEK